MNQDCPSVWIFAWGSTHECQRFIDHHVETVLSNDHVSENNFSPKNQPGAVKAKMFNENAAFCLSSLRSTSSPSSYAAPDGSMSWVVVCWCDQWTSAAVSHDTNDTNDMTLNSKTTSVKIRLEAQVVFAIGPLRFGGTAKFPANLQEFHVRESRPCPLLSETWQKCGKTHALPPSPRLREGRGCSGPPPLHHKPQRKSLRSEAVAVLRWQLGHLVGTSHGYVPC